MLRSLCAVACLLGLAGCPEPSLPKTARSEAEVDADTDVDVDVDADTDVDIDTDTDVDADIDADVARVPTPDDVVVLRRTDPGAARRWRLRIREELGGRMAHGGAVVGFTRDGDYLVRGGT